MDICLTVKVWTFLKHYIKNKSKNIIWMLHPHYTILNVLVIQQLLTQNKWLFWVKRKIINHH